MFPGLGFLAAALAASGGLSRSSNDEFVRAFNGPSRGTDGPKASFTRVAAPDHTEHQSRARKNRLLHRDETTRLAKAKRAKSRI